MSERKLVDINDIKELSSDYPKDFIKFCKANEITLPACDTAKGQALSIMVHNKGKYFNRQTCDEFCRKFSIKATDSIKLFCGAAHKPIECSKEKGKYYVHTAKCYQFRAEYQSQKRRKPKHRPKNPPKRLKLANTPS
jgi:hypothetical protein